MQSIRVLFRPDSRTGSTDLSKRADSNESFVHESDIATRQIRGCFDVRMRLGQAAVDVIELHDSPLSGPEFTPSKGNANR